jgi:hypothetical protein
MILSHPQRIVRGDLRDVTWRPEERMQSMYRKQRHITNVTCAP